SHEKKQKRVKPARRAKSLALLVVEIIHRVNQNQPGDQRNVQEEKSAQPVSPKVAAEPNGARVINRQNYTEECGDLHSANHQGEQSGPAVGSKAEQKGDAHNRY